MNATKFATTVKIEEVVGSLRGTHKYSEVTDPLVDELGGVETEHLKFLGL